MQSPILLVEDAPNDIKLALFALKKCGVQNEVVVTRSGDEALEYLFRVGRYKGRPTPDPGMILLDLKLPTVDGISVLRTIRETSSLSSIPVIVVTASALEADVTRTMELGVERYVVKPMDLQEFVEQMCAVAAQFNPQ